YVHLPFCEVICHYCDFYTARAKDARHEEFFEALNLEAQQNLPKLSQPLDALYFGGGTPSVSPPHLLHAFIDLFRPHLTPDTEITMEANPANINPENVKAWKAAGINRISLGVQSLDNPTLKRLGRVHSAESALESIRLIASEIKNVSADLIYGVPEQDKEIPAIHAKALAEAGATHVSAYHLTIPASHFLHRRLPDDAYAWDQIELVAEALAQRGFRHYEVSNFGLPGKESRNNGNYWRGGPYLALGPSAHGFDGDRTRWKNVADWEAYVRRLKNGGSPLDETEILTDDQRKIEVVFTSLRTLEGLDLTAFRARFREDLQSRHAAFFAKLEEEKLASLSNEKLVLSFRGRMLADEIAAKLL
ncbi:MAG: radical SAM family heme chaperone HemW, partial [Proteobacteria bacterium]